MDPEDLRDPAQPKPGEDGGDLTDPPEGQEAELPEDVEALKTRLNNAERTIVGLKKSAGVNTVKELKGKLAPPPKPVEKPADPKPEQGEHVTREEIALLQKGYSPEEIDIAKRLAPGKSLAEAVADEVASTAIEGLRQKRKAKDAVLDPSNRVPSNGAKSFGDLKPAEKKSQYANKVQEALNKARQKERSPGR